MLNWAAMKGAELGRNYLRLDCEASREKLCRIYEKFGFEREGEILLGERKMIRFELNLCR
jgi:RimJ/RimL family protein N-acetyltransferase